MKLSAANKAITRSPEQCRDERERTHESGEGMHACVGERNVDEQDADESVTHGSRGDASNSGNDRDATGTLWPGRRQRSFRITKIDTTLRALKTSSEPLEFSEDAALGSSAYQLAQHHSASRTELRIVRCTSNSHHDLRRCVAKVTSSYELACNEWDHLTNIRTSAFPTAFLFGRLENESEERFAIIMELIEGETLAEVIERGFGETRGPAPVEKALEIISPLASAFRDLSLSLHPFVHRDVKPANIIISQREGMHLTRMIDLGVASHRGDPRQREHMGYSEGYAAPELVWPQSYPEGATFSADDARIDTYGLAATLFCLLTGQAPTQAEAYADPSKLTHDEFTLKDIKHLAQHAIHEKHLIKVDDAAIDLLLARAMRTRDEELARAIQNGLAPLQSERPTPAEFFESLPTNYRTMLVNDIHLLFLEELAKNGAAASNAPGSGTPSPTLTSIRLGGRQAVDLRGTALDDEYRYPGFRQDFHAAMELYNAGRYHKAVPLLMKLDEAGDATAAYNLGVCYKDGLGGLPQDHARKLACWTRAAEGGHIMAIFNVGLCHEEGSGVPQSPEARTAAITWYQRAANMGLPAAAMRLEHLRSQAV